MTYRVIHDLRRLEQRLADYPSQQMAAAVRALNRTATTVKAEANKALRVEYPGMKASAIGARLKKLNASRREPRSAVVFSEKRFRLWGNFSAVQTKRGVRMTRVPWAIETLDGQRVSRAALAHAFIQKTRAGGIENVWIRVGAQRYPITALLAPSLATTLKARNIGDRLIYVGHRRFAVVIEQEMTYRLSKKGAI